MADGAFCDYASRAVLYVNETVSDEVGGGKTGGAGSAVYEGVAASGFLQRMNANLREKKNSGETVGKSVTK